MSKLTNMEMKLRAAGLPTLTDAELDQVSGGLPPFGYGGRGASLGQGATVLFPGGQPQREDGPGGAFPDGLILRNGSLIDLSPG